MFKNTILILLIFACQKISSQVEYSGKIIGVNNKPIPFVNIIAKSKKDSTLVKGVISNIEGDFKISLQQPNNSFLTISFIGFKSKNLLLQKSKQLGTIKLESQTENLEDVVISVQKPFIQREQDKLIVNVEGSIVSTGNSTMEVLEKSPGIIIDQDDNISLSGRTGVRVYIDNKDTRLQGEQLANLLRSMPSSTIEKIEIITNPSVKYEAQGNAGIINIVTKKGKFYGTNGSITISPGQGKYFRWNNSIDINHRTEKLNVYGQYSYANRNQYQEIVIDRVFLQDNEPTALYTLQNDFELPIINHTGRLGLDYYFNANTTIGVLITGLSNDTENNSLSNVLGYDTSKNLISEENTFTDIDSKWNQFTSNINAKHTFKNKDQINFNFDIARYNNLSDQKFKSDFQYFENDTSFEEILLGDIEGYLNLTGITLDYELSFKNGDRFEAGWKNTWVKSDNNLIYANEVNEITVPNTNLSNHFIYDEDIYAAYVSYNFNNKKWNGQIGLRAENTFIKGNQLTSQIVFKNDYFNLFPTASYNYILNENHTFGVSVGRRIDRPSYGQLNPFRTFVNTNTYREGNPFLTPQFTWSGELNYMYKQKYYFALNYGYTIDNLSMAIIRDGSEEVVIVRPINISNLKSYSLVASVPIKIANWWQSNWNVNATLNDFDGEINGYNFNRNNPVVSLNMNHSLSLGKGFRFQLSGFYLFPHYGSITKAETISSISIGLQKNIMKNKATIRFNVNDIFWNQYPTGRTQFGNLDDSFTSYRDTRYGTFSFTWRFGKQSVRPQSGRQSEIQNELNRARENNTN